MNFVKVKDKLINLEHVSSFNILDNRVAFDFDCPVELKDKTISYYAYGDLSNIDLLNNEYIIQNFIIYNSVRINRNHITAIKFEEDKNRVIINLSHSVTSYGYGHEKRITSKFLYCDFDRIEDYNDFTMYLTDKIK